VASLLPLPVELALPSVVQLVVLDLLLQVLLLPLARVFLERPHRSLLALEWLALLVPLLTCLFEEGVLSTSENVAYERETMEQCGS